jgi:uncharacterized protein YggU (UPF0235/DUF167 family)
MPKPWYRWKNEALILVYPANRHLLKYLATLCGVRRKQVNLVSGANGRNQRVVIEYPKTLPAGVDPPEL